MQGFDYATMYMDAYDEFGALVAANKEFLMSSGPFHIASNDTVRLTIAIMAAYDTIALKTLSDTAQQIYNSSLGVAAHDQPRRPAEVVALKLLNEPNPFHRSTEMKYQVPSAGPVKLAIYNINGQLVRTLVDGWKDPGIYSVKWNGRDQSQRPVAAGTYMYRLQAGGTCATGKMVFIK